MAAPVPIIPNICLFLLFRLACTGASGQYDQRPGISLAPKIEVDSITQETAAYGVLRRLLPRHEASFDFRVVTEGECGGFSCFRISNYPEQGRLGGPEIRISGTSGVEVCAGLYWYLKRWCGAHISWEKTGGAQLKSVPERGSLPRVHAEGVQIRRLAPWNYYQNVVTSSYSFVWWRWERWEKEIDWMALQGINLPLAFTGQETIWQRVFQTDKFKLSKADLDEYFGGPAFLAWSRMGNLHGWGGPLPQSWLDQQLELQLLILSRMRALGMTPVLPSFSGNVPAALLKKFPSVKYTQLGDWNSVDGNRRWCCTYLLDPTDPLFVDLGRAFIEQQVREYGGTQHIYSCDTFNENLPPTSDPAYISKLGAAVYEAMSAGDSEAVWLMQGWLFVSEDSFWKPPQMQALLHSVPLGKLVVLDLYADVKPVWLKSNHFYGTPYIWCMLHNFGGNIEMYGRLPAVMSGPIAAVKSPKSTMVGVGMCMEGIEQNPVVYELMAEMSFHHEIKETEDWVVDYSKRRYGKAAEGAELAWKILHRSIYNCGDGIADHNGDVIVEFPDRDPSQMENLIRANDDPIWRTRDTKMSLLASSGVLGHNPHLWYSPADAVQALGYLLSSADELGREPPYRCDVTLVIEFEITGVNETSAPHWSLDPSSLSVPFNQDAESMVHAMTDVAKYDLVDLTRQVLSKLANELHTQIIQAFQLGKVKEVQSLSRQLLRIFDHTERLLASCDGFLLGPWLESAKCWSTNQEEKDLYEWNARTQVTMWFDNTEDQPSLLHDYANKMWSGLVKDYYRPRASLFLTLLQESVSTNATFPFDVWRKQWMLLTNKWQAGSGSYPVAAVGDSIQIVKELYNIYRNVLALRHAELQLHQRLMFA